MPATVSFSTHADASALVIRWDASSIMDRRRMSNSRFVSSSLANLCRTFMSNGFRKSSKWARGGDGGICLATATSKCEASFDPAQKFRS
jgi:hypothetical protein